MKKFRLDDNIRRHLFADSGQVSHGLNLVLRLRDPLQMPYLLLEIAKRQQQVGEALDELNFVHFARFLPTRSGSALQVITEFDGDLEPYAMDFAIAIGDIFTVILSFVVDRPPLPVKDHPDEFWAFIKRNNRVSIAGISLPEESYYPVYSAYPEMTVLDIVGPRKQLPLPVADRPSADIDLADVQGNLLEGYRARIARHYILAVTDAPRARAWLAALARPEVDPQDGSLRITTAEPQAVKPTTMLNVGFTHAGLEALGIEPALLCRFPQAFRDGPANEKRARANGDTGPSAPAQWIFGAVGGVEHAMLSLYACKHAKASSFEAADGALRRVLGDREHGCGMKLLSTHDATALPGCREHFGFRDGIAQPRFAHHHNGPKDMQSDMQPAVSPGEFLLGENYKDIFGGPSIGKLSPQLATNGTFCAVRVLAQDVGAFEKLLDEGACRLNVSRELIAAKLVGRWRDGQPLALYPDRPDPSAATSSAGHSNEFDYAPSYEYPRTFDDSAGMRCPIGSHIRRVNPRTSRTAGVRYSRRLVRRGMPYHWGASNGKPEEKGIFGLFYCGSLERQFEFIQQQWVEGDLFTTGIRGTQDPIGGSQTRSRQFALPGLGSNGTTAMLEVPRLVTTRASLYLFMPGIRALQALDQPGLAAPRQHREYARSWRKVRELASGGLFLQVMWDRTFPVAAASEPDGFDPTSRAFLVDPYPAFASFRQASPVHYVPRHRAYWAFSHEHVLRLCTDDRHFLKLKPGRKMLRGLLTMDPPRHTQVRAVMNQAFRMAIGQAAEIAEEVTDQALNRIDDREFDLVEGFARPVSQGVFFRMMGIPERRQAEVDRLARTMLASFDRTLGPAQRLRFLASGFGLSIALLAMLPGATLGPRGTLLHETARLIRRQRGADLTVSEAVMTLLQFVLAGYLSTEFLLCTGTRNLLLEGREPWQAVQAKPALLQGAIEEMRRFDAPLGVIERYAAVDTVLGGVKIPAGSLLMGMLGSANHDHRVFGCTAERFDILRPPGTSSLALGHGIHECIGRPLQAAVVPIALRKLMTRFPDLALASRAQPPWLPNPYFRSFSRLLVSTG